MLFAGDVICSFLHGVLASRVNFDLPPSQTKFPEFVQDLVRQRKTPLFDGNLGMWHSAKG